MNEESEPGPFTRVIIQRNVEVPGGDTYGVEAVFTIPGTPYGPDLLQALDPAVRRLDQATVDGLADHVGAAQAFRVADLVAEAEARWQA